LIKISILIEQQPNRQGYFRVIDKVLNNINSRIPNNNNNL